MKILVLKHEEGKEENMNLMSRILAYLFLMGSLLILPATAASAEKSVHEDDFVK